MYRGSRMKTSLRDFDLHSTQSGVEYIELVYKLIYIYMIKIQQCKQRPDESISDYYDRLERTLKQSSVMKPESFSKTKMILQLHLFLEGMQEALDNLTKLHKLSWLVLHTSTLITLANQISKTIKRKERNTSIESMNFQLYQ